MGRTETFCTSFAAMNVPAVTATRRTSAKEASQASHLDDAQEERDRRRPRDRLRQPRSSLHDEAADRFRPVSRSARAWPECYAEVDGRRSIVRRQVRWPADNVSPRTIGSNESGCQNSHASYACLVRAGPRPRRWPSTSGRRVGLVWQSRQH